MARLNREEKVLFKKTFGENGIDFIGDEGIPIRDMNAPQFAKHLLAQEAKDRDFFEKEYPVFGKFVSNVTSHFKNEVTDMQAATYYAYLFHNRECPNNDLHILNASENVRNYVGKTYDFPALVEEYAPLSKKTPSDLFFAEIVKRANDNLKKEINEGTRPSFKGMSVNGPTQNNI